jgi:hypothetical protein
LFVDRPAAGHDLPGPDEALRQQPQHHRQFMIYIRSRQALQDIEKITGSFPSLHGAHGLNPWKSEALDAWASGLKEDDPALHAARFLLELWNDSVQWRCGAFDLVRAMCCWDFLQRAAYLNYLHDLHADRPERCGTLVFGADQGADGQVAFAQDLDHLVETLEA